MPRRLKVLVTDDAAVMRHLLVHWLEKMIHCEITQAADGLEAIRKIREAAAQGNPFDLLLTDVKMPHVDGLRLVEYVRQKLMDHKTPIIVITTFSDAAIRDQALRLGATGYITKPLKYYELLRAMIRLFGGYLTDEKRAAMG